ncbi:MAG: hypothetical protein GF330_00985 [Candidatus Eisenbacteria bacterium]|nr:hypothetical protein [Candidatus Eisenbacteria bacterium]
MGRRIRIQPGTQIGRAMGRIRRGLPFLLVVFVAGLLLSCGEDAAPPALLEVSPAHVRVAASDSGAAFELRNLGSGRLTWQMRQDAPWLDPRYVEGAVADAETLRLQVDRDSVSLPPPRATVVIESPAGRDSVSVTLWRALSTEPGTLLLERESAAAIRIRSLGTVPLLWRSRSLVDWLRVEPASGVLEEGEDADTLQLTVHAQSLPAGEHTGRVVVSAGALGTDSIAVRLPIPQLRGQLFFDGTRIPIPDVRVAVGDLCDTTDADGAYAFATVATGSQTLSASREGFTMLRAEIEVSESGTVWDGWLQTETYAHAVAGVVRNSRGLGVALAVGTLLNPDGSLSERSAISDPEGRFELTGVPDGQRTIRWENFYYEPLETRVEVVPGGVQLDATLTALPVAPPARYDNQNHVHLERAGCRGVRIVWLPRFEETAAGYRIERGPSADGPFSEIAAVAGRQHDHYLDTVPAFGQYAYRVRTENIEGVVGAPTDPEHDRITLDVWSLLSSGTAYGDSLHRYSQVTLYDPQFERMIMFGGVGCEGGHCGDDFNDTWAFDLEARDWELLDAGSGPGKRQSHVAIYDITRQRMVIHGGINLTQGVVYRDTWAFDLRSADGGGWTLLDPGTAGPGYRFEHLGVYSGATDDRLLIHGGKDGENEVRSDLWAFDLATHSWERLLDGGFGGQDPQPLRRYGHAGVYDAMRHRIVFYGGQRSSSVIYEDAWSLDLGTSTWTALPAGPGPRYAHAAVYDPDADRMLIYGGRAQSDTVYDDLQALGLDAAVLWEPLAPQQASGPGPRYNHSMIFDRHAGRLLLFAGIKPRSDPELRPDCWAYCLPR